MSSEQKSIFSSSSNVFDWLDKFINLERGQKPKSFRIDRMQFLCSLAAHPERCAPSIHVAGSKGKGSVTSMITNILTAAGFRAARFMSPHVIDIRERICLGDEYFSEDVYCAAGNELRELAEIKLPAACNPLFDEENAAPAGRADSIDSIGCEPTYFELLTLYFFLCARQANCDAMVAETGMGGRLDSTNVLDPLVSVITLIELEHTSYLGDTIGKIAEEKAGIIKPGKPLILAQQPAPALQVFQKTTQEKYSPLHYLPDTAQLSDIKINQDGTSFSLSATPCARTEGSTAPLREIFLPIPGKVQANNAALAITAAKTAFPQITEEAIRTGLANLRLPARFEKIAGDPPLIIDGAHTPESLQLCIETFCSLYGEEGILIFGCAADKDEHEMARIACSASGGCPHFSKIIITGIGSFKANDPKKVYEAFVKHGRENVLLIEDLRCAFASLREDNMPALATGSFYLVSEIRKLVKNIKC